MAAKLAEIGTSVEGKLIYAVLDPNGWVSCSVDDSHTYWCSHLKSAMQENTDSELIWPIPESVDKTPLVIPMFPTVNLYSQVDLVNMGKNWLVMWECPATSDPIQLCILSKGEGRNVIRSMLWQHYLSHGKNVYKECEAKHHGYAAEVARRRNSPEAEMWCLYTEKMCITCCKDMSFDDLLPGTKPTVFRK